MKTWIVKIPSNPKENQYVVLRFESNPFSKIRFSVIGTKVPMLLIEDDLRKVQEVLDEQKVEYTVHEITIP